MLSIIIDSSLLVTDQHRQSVLLDYHRWLKYFGGAASIMAVRRITGTWVITLHLYVSTTKQYALAIILQRLTAYFTMIQSFFQVSRLVCTGPIVFEAEMSKHGVIKQVLRSC